MTIQQLRTICEENGLRLSDEELAKLDGYAQELLVWNSKVNLISRKDEENVLSRHLLHSLTLRMPEICNYDFSGKRVMDVGTGGGLPGIPLKIVTSGSNVTLIDSIQKKIGACTAIIAELGLTGIRAVAGRSEDLSKSPEMGRTFDAVVSRAVAPLEDLLKWTQGLLKAGGVLFSLKGGDLEEEIKRTQRMSIVESVEEKPLRLRGYEDFEREGKKLIRVVTKR